MKKTLFILFIVLLIATFGIVWWLSKNEVQKPIITTNENIHLTSPRPNATIKSPLTITGEARGNWFFEASFPVVLTNWDGLIIAQGIAQAKGEWMTTDFVPFEATFTFTVDKNVYSNKGSLILQKDNPSGLPEYDDALEIPIVFSD
ncbi:MAG: Gmad2 immunoglobulin-like domain-containing protein [Patescibacteria group bacterium]|nr:Gmad2 immunoglobulin-like domain-containing protein [Patescibacteria group bacterium]